MSRKLLLTLAGSISIIVIAVLLVSYNRSPGVTEVSVFKRDFRELTRRYITAIAGSYNTLELSKSHSVMMSCYSFGRSRDDQHPFVELSRIMRKTHKEMRSGVSYKRFELSLYTGIRHRDQAAVARCLKKYFKLAPVGPDRKEVRMMFSLTGPWPFKIRQTRVLRTSWTNMSDRLGHRDKNLKGSLARADYIIDFELQVAMKAPLYQKVRHAHPGIVAIRKVRESGAIFKVAGKLVANYNLKTRNWSYRKPRVILEHIWKTGRTKKFFPEAAVIVQNKQHLDSIIKNNMRYATPDNPDRTTGNRNPKTGSDNNLERPSTVKTGTDIGAGNRDEKRNRLLAEKRKKLLAELSRRTGKPAWRHDAEYHKYYLLGKHYYRALCQQCHRSDGKGVRNRYPDLRRNSYLKGNSSQLVTLLLNGKKGMPAFKNLPDRTLASIVVYIRDKWGTVTWPFSEADIRFYR